MFQTGAWKLRASSSSHKPSSFFIETRRQKSSVPRKAILIRIPRCCRFYEERGKRYGNTGGNGITGMRFSDGRVIRRSEVNIKALDVLYKSTVKLYLKHHIYIEVAGSR
jgi:hypothetical protein